MPNEQTKTQPLADAVQDIRTNLHYSADYLRRLDLEQSEMIARKLDRLRASLRQFVKSTVRENEHVNRS